MAKFESSVNSEGIETQQSIITRWRLFESSVNSEGIETISHSQCLSNSLRAV